MTPTLLIVAETATVNWLLLLAASLIRARFWTPAGMRVALGNREEAPEPSGLAGRTDRAARNMLENLVLFTALVLVATLGGLTDARVEQGARLFFWARLAYIPVYMAGVPYLRTGVWAISIVGLGMILSAILGAA